MAKNQKLSVDGKDYSPDKGFFDATLNILLPGAPDKQGPVAGLGTPISKAIFEELRRRYGPGPGDPKTDWVMFSRETILTILAQYNCAGIRFYFVERPYTDSKQLTLVMAGVDAEGNDLVSKGEGVGGDGDEGTYFGNWVSGYPPTTP